MGSEVLQKGKNFVDGLEESQEKSRSNYLSLIVGERKREFIGIRIASMLYNKCASE